MLVYYYTGIYFTPKYIHVDIPSVDILHTMCSCTCTCNIWQLVHNGFKQVYKNIYTMGVQVF